MRVFVTGASGHIASAVIPELQAAGHTVTGLVRSDQAAATVQSLGAEIRRGDLDDLDALSAGAREADGVIHLAFKHQEMRSGDLAAAVASDLRAIEAIGSALEGSQKPFVGTNATLGLVMAGFSGELTENDTLPGGPRIDAENAVIALADRGVRSSVVRLPPTVHTSDHCGFVSGLIGIARTRGVAAYLGDGENRWPTAHTEDVAHLYRLALEHAPAGSRLHAVAESGVTLSETAQTIARQLDVPVASVATEDASTHFTHMTPFIGLDNPTSSNITRDLLGWTPTRSSLLDDLDEGLLCDAVPSR